MAVTSKLAWFVAVVGVVALVVLVVLFNKPEGSVTRRLTPAFGLSVHPAPGEGKDWSHLNYKKDCNGNTYSSLKEKFAADGHITFRSCSLKVEQVDAVSDFVGTIKTSRVGDAWVKEDSVRDLAVDPDTLDFLGYLHGRQAFPFQTLNFPLATQQPVHSDVIHFDTLPVRGLMTAAWVALEDIHPDSGPLIYYSGSHKMGKWLVRGG
jgi:hypothetical protein